MNAQVKANIAFQPYCLELFFFFKHIIKVTVEEEMPKCIFDGKEQLTLISIYFNEI